MLGALANSLDIAKTKRDGREAIIWETGKNSTINGIMLNIMISLYQEENEARARRANEGKEGKLKMGYWPATFQKFGYMTIRDAIGVKIVEGSPSEIKTVQQIFDWYDSSVGCTEIRRRLIANGVEQQEDFTGQRMHDWNTSTIGNLLRSKEYTGVVTFKFKNGNTFDFSIPQYVSEAQFNRVQKKMDKGRVNNQRNTKNVYLLQGLVYDEHDHPLLVQPSPKYNYKTLANGRRKRYLVKSKGSHRYSCARVARHGKDKGFSHASPASFHGQELDNAVWQFVVKNVILHPELITEQVEAKSRRLQRQGDDIDSEISLKRGRLEAIAQERMKYARQQARGKITEELFDVLIAECDDLENELQTELDHLLFLRDEQAAVQAGNDYVLDLIKNFQERLPEINQSPDELAAMNENQQHTIMAERQKILRALCDMITVYTDGRIILEGLIEVKDGTVVGATAPRSALLSSTKVRSRWAQNGRRAADPARRLDPQDPRRRQKPAPRCAGKHHAGQAFERRSVAPEPPNLPAAG